MILDRPLLNINLRGNPLNRATHSLSRFGNELSAPEKLSDQFRKYVLQAHLMPRRRILQFSIKIAALLAHILSRSGTNNNASNNAFRNATLPFSPCVRTLASGISQSETNTTVSIGLKGMIPRKANSPKLKFIWTTSAIGCMLAKLQAHIFRVSCFVTK